MGLKSAWLYQLLNATCFYLLGPVFEFMFNLCFTSGITNMFLVSMRAKNFFA